ncbi:multidrug efflux SMR transporter [Virgibacillus sp. NKC19-16]|uniref:DMT family transporter n=1 Tax=Virgibacillus salidurans TaxID=2831673 RepID=UPI001F2D7BB5|nr:multidrug efflux SMR transporter [Virgibacillus sp. NKC19-16]UJL48335.1 multidrug efflux SMR transporter [Virgibacillus sp. NKC19-16]
MKWLLVVIAAAFEVGWATGLKYANNTLTWTLTGIAVIISFWLLLKAATSLPTSTAYAVFAGLGTVGTVIVDIFFFNAAINMWMIIFIVLLLVGVIGLKTVTGETTERREHS